MTMLLLFISWILLVSVSAAPVSFSPADNFLLNCGGSGDEEVDGRRFAGEDRSKGILQIENGDRNVVVSGKSGNGLPEIYRAARVFKKEATYRFSLREPGWFWIRLHFFAGKFGEFDLSKSVFNVYTDKVMLIYTSNFTAAGRAAVEEYLIGVAGDEKKLNLRFEPQSGSVAFINAIEVVSAPANLITDAAVNLFPVGGVVGLTRHGYKSEHQRMRAHDHPPERHPRPDVATGRGIPPSIGGGKEGLRRDEPGNFPATGRYGPDGAVEGLRVGGDPRRLRDHESGFQRDVELRRQPDPRPPGQAPLRRHRQR